MKKKGRKNLTANDLIDMYKKMLKAQRDGGDFDLTVRDLCLIWNYPTSTSSAVYHIPKLIDMGLVKCKPASTGGHKRYRAIERPSQKGVAVNS